MYQLVNNSDDYKTKFSLKSLNGASLPAELLTTGDTANKYYPPKSKKKNNDGSSGTTSSGIAGKDDVMGIDGTSSRNGGGISQKNYSTTYFYFTYDLLSE